jgi:hypothetical protein
MNIEEYNGLVAMMESIKLNILEIWNNTICMELRDRIFSDKDFKFAINKLVPGTRFAVTSRQEIMEVWIMADIAARKAIRDYNPWRLE